MEAHLVNKTEKDFESIKHIDEDGIEFWYARELMIMLEYSKWGNFKNVIKKAKDACKGSNIREVDRIRWIQEKKNTLCEDNESVAVYTICDRFNIPCVGFRTITNNEVTQAEKDGATSTRNDIAKNANRMIFKQHDALPAKVSQLFTIEYTKKLIKKFQ